MASTNVKTVDQISLFHTESNLDGLRLLSPTEVHGGGGLELVKPALEPASNRLKPCASLENAPEMWSVRSSLSALVRVRRKHQRSAFPSETSRLAPVIIAHKGSALPWLVDDHASLRPRRTWYLPTQQYKQQHACACCGALQGFPRQCHMPLACDHLPKGTQLEPYTTYGCNYTVPLS